MFTKLQQLKPIISRQTLLPSILQKFKYDSLHPTTQYPLNPTFTIFTQNLTDFDSNTSAISHTRDSIIPENVSHVKSILKLHIDTPIKELEEALEKCGVCLKDDFVLQVIKCHRSEWKSALRFFDWVSKKGESNGYSPGTEVYNEVLDIVGRMKRFVELRQVFDAMSQREGLVNERTFAVLVNRYAAGHKVEEAIEVFDKRRELGFGVDSDFDLFAFKMLLLSLCRHKHVEAAESLFLSKQNEFPPDIKMLNIILNGWCVRGNLREAKRFWKDIVSSKCRPDRFTYGIFINALTKSGKLGTAVKLFSSMWNTPCTPDVAICSCVIDALCFKKRIPKALEVFDEMKERGCPPDASTYNSLIKHLCKIVRMEKVYELLEEMEEKKGNCTPNAITFNYLLKSAKKPHEIPALLERMRRNAVGMTGDSYNVILRLFLDWNDKQGVRSVWEEMEKNGVGPDQRSYTMMIHSLHKKGRFEEALKYFDEMMAKGMIPEPRTDLLVTVMKTKLKETGDEQGVQKINEGSLSSVFLKYDMKE